MIWYDCSYFVNLVCVCWGSGVGGWSVIEKIYLEICFWNWWPLIYASLKYTAGKKLSIFDCVTYFSRTFDLNKIVYSHKNIHLHVFHLQKPAKQISAYTDDLRTAWQIRVLWNCQKLTKNVMRLWYFSFSVNSFFKAHAQPSSWDRCLMFGWTFVCFHFPCVRTAKVLVRLCGCAGSPEPSVVAYVKSAIISWAGSIYSKTENVSGLNLNSGDNFYAKTQ